jgi:hypothetical protein
MKEIDLEKRYPHRFLFCIRGAGGELCLLG